MRGAAGGIGIMTVQLAARGGASAVAVTTSSAERGDRLRKLGATHVLDRAGEGGEDAPPGYDVIIDMSPVLTCLLSSPGSTRTAAWWSWA